MVVIVVTSLMRKEYGMDVPCNFERALQHLREGKKVRNGKWLEGTYIFLQNDNLWLHNADTIAQKISAIPADQILSESWFIL